MTDLAPAETAAEVPELDPRALDARRALRTATGFAAAITPHVRRVGEIFAELAALRDSMVREADAATHAADEVRRLGGELGVDVEGLLPPPPDINDVREYCGQICAVMVAELGIDDDDLAELLRPTTREDPAG